VRNQSRLFLSTTLIFALLSVLSSVPAYAAYQRNETIVNAAGNTSSGSSRKLYNSTGEPAIGQSYGKTYSVRAGFFHNSFRLASTPALTPALTPTPIEEPTAKPAMKFGGHIKIYNSLLKPLKGEVARVRWTQPENGPTTIRIYNILGELVKTLVSGQKQTGRNTREPRCSLVNTRVRRTTL